MANDFYEVQRRPSERVRAKAGLLAAELDSIEEGFERLPTKNDLAGNVQIQAEETSTSAANIYVIKGEYPITELKKGTRVSFFCQNTNTGASTGNVDSTGVKDIKAINGDALLGSEIVAGRPIDLIYNGTNLLLENSAKAITVSLVLASALTPRNFALRVAIKAFTLPAASGGSSPYTYAVTGLPRNLLFSAGSRKIVGTPKSLGSSTITYKVTDSNAIVFNFQFVIKIVPTVLILGNPKNRNLKLGNSYTFTLPAASDGTSPYAYVIDSNELPAGMSFDAQSRELSGTPTEAGAFDITYQATDSGTTPQTATQGFRLTVRSATVLAIGSTSDRTFVPDTEITPFVLPAASGGLAPYVYILTGLPSGLNFDAATRKISGTPGTVETRTVTYRVTDGESTEVERQFEIVIETSGRRYIFVVDKGDKNVTATEIQSGNELAATAQELELPIWTGNKRIAIAQPEANDDLDPCFPLGARECSFRFYEAALHPKR